MSLLLVLLAGGSLAAAPVYSVTDLGDLPGGENYSQALDINASGQVVGVSANSSRFRAFVSAASSDETTPLVDLGNLPQLPSTRANAVNSSGQIVGSSSDGDRGRAFLWSPTALNGTSGSMVEVENLPGERNHSNASSINDMGQVVGYSSGRAYLWTPSAAHGTTGTAVDLGGLPGGGDASLAFDINSSGQVVGSSSTDLGDHAFLWTPLEPNGNTGNMIDLGNLNGANGASQAIAINGAGAVVGNSATATGQHAFLWTPDNSPVGGSMTDLGDLEGGNDLSYAYGVNGSNQIVGYSNSSDGDHAFYWTAADGIRDLNSLVDASGAGWVLRFAQSINDQGQIVGWGTFDPDGSGEIPPATHAFRLDRVGAGPAPVQLGNISTRLRVLTADNALIGGFIITGTEAKRVIIRGLGASLSDHGVEGGLADPTLELHQGSILVAANDNWKDTQQTEIEASTIPPTRDSEAAMVQTLEPGAYTAILRGRNDSTGIGLIEVYDLTPGAASKLTNISTRGFVDTGDNRMIGGLIVTGNSGGRANVIVRAIGPSLSDVGVSDVLRDTALELYGANGALIDFNDNWRSAQEAEIIATQLSPRNDAESAIVRALTPGNYTAIVRGVDNAAGVALVEIYHLE